MALGWQLYEYVSVLVHDDSKIRAYSVTKMCNILHKGKLTRELKTATLHQNQVTIPNKNNYCQTNGRTSKLAVYVMT